MASKKKAASEEVVTAYKGFKQDLTCRGYQFEIGGTYKHEGEVEACASGFHSCEYPLDVFGYYAPSESRFAIVKASGHLSRHNDDSKIASATLVVEAEISMPTMISRAIDWVMSKVDKSVEQTVVGETASNTGYQSAASNTGYQSAASNTGDYSAASNTGDYSAASNTGDYSAASNTGNRSAASNTGDYSAASNTGNRSAASNTGYQSAAEVSGKESVAASLGIEGRARASAGSAIVLCHRDDEGRLIHIRASKVGENGVEPDTWYQLSADGEFVEFEE
ncbi:hypothetical protein I5J08_08795 [Pseudomonas aeruginosa]|uniref:DUF7666 domain-containing protein n=1 Tax=Pseudomonas aeruginosa TaxID=287 RepID=UPI00071B4FE5|nr:hypothetical protein [Pseudomonas aeruginosa]KSK12207.1 hypothetical protein APA08_09550 [Pseudomonas aeruginosa]MBG6853009.1 hypothetical protein [Pseudomonas aeruginosa]MBR7857787.1 hypothetical protein [Pseudomonas aeruginosa]MBR7876828.1 hypothetical protein [Pseudomonas aeruginosa]MCV6459743.1 hypothetical protein [Pseudomonas aeruginosa]